MRQVAALSFRTRMLLLPGTATLAFVAVLALTRAVDGRERRLLEQLERGDVPQLELAREAEQRMVALDQALQDARLARDAAAVRRAERARDALAGTLRRGRALPGGDLRELDALAAEVGAYHRAAAGAALDLASGKAAAADVTVLARGDALRARLEKRTQARREAVAARLAEVDHLRAAGSVAVAAAIGAAVLVIGALAASISARVVSPLVKLTDGVSRIARQGDLTVELDVQGDGEVEALGLSVAAMVAKLRAVPRAVEASVHQLEGASRELASSTEQQLAVGREQVSAVGRALAVAELAARVRATSAARAERVARLAGEAEASGQATLRGLRGAAEGASWVSSRLEVARRTSATVRELLRDAALQVDAAQEAATHQSARSLELAVEASRLGPAGEQVGAAARDVRATAAQAVQAAVRLRSLVTTAQRELGDPEAEPQEAARARTALSDLEATGSTVRELLVSLQRTAAAAREVISALDDGGAAIGDVSRALGAVDRQSAVALADSERTGSAARRLQETTRELQEIVAGFRF